MVLEQLVSKINKEIDYHRKAMVSIEAIIQRKTPETYMYQQMYNNHLGIIKVLEKILKD